MTNEKNANSDDQTYSSTKTGDRSILPDDMIHIDSGVLPVPPNVSDHDATYITIPFPYCLHTSYERKVWLYNKADYTLFNEQITAFDWNQTAPKGAV